MEAPRVRIGQLVEVTIHPLQSNSQTFRGRVTKIYIGNGAFEVRESSGAETFCLAHELRRAF